MERLKSPTLAVVMSSARVEHNLVNMTSRLTTIPDKTFFHSDLRKAGKLLADCNDQIACFRLAV